MPYFEFPQSANYLSNVLNEYKEKSSVVNALSKLLPEPYEASSYLMPIGSISKLSGKNAALFFEQETHRFRDIHGGIWNTGKLKTILEKWVKKLEDSPEKEKAIKYLNEFYSGIESPEVALEVAAEWIHKGLRKMGIK